MNSKKAILLPKYRKQFEKIGENIKLARKRRKLTAEQVTICSAGMVFNLLLIQDIVMTPHRE